VVPRLAQVRPEVPSALAAIIERALSREVEHRYPDLRDMARELADFVATWGARPHLESAIIELCAITPDRQTLALPEEGLGSTATLATGSTASIEGSALGTDSTVAGEKTVVARRTPRRWPAVALAASVVVLVAAVVLGLRGTPPREPEGAPIEERTPDP